MSADEAGRARVPVMLARQARCRDRGLVPRRTACCECRTGFIETARAACGGQLFYQTERATGRRSTRPIVDNAGDLARINFLWAMAWLRTIAVRRSRGGGVINPRSMAVLIRDSATDPFKDNTRRVSEIQTAGQRIEIVFNSSNTIFRSYSAGADGGW